MEFGERKVNNVALGTYITNYKKILGVNTLVFRVENIDLYDLLKNKIAWVAAELQNWDVKLNQTLFQTGQVIKNYL